MSPQSHDSRLTRTPAPDSSAAPSRLMIGGSRAGRLAHQVTHLAVRPRAWLLLGRWLARRIAGRVLPKGDAGEQALRIQQGATAWCSATAVAPAEAMARLGLPTEIVSLRQRFPDDVAAAEERVGTVPFRLGGASNLDLIYALCEALHVTRAIETGVAYGWSSLAILLSIEQRQGGSLHSIDLPYLKYQNDRWVGVAVPDRLRPCWTLHRTADREGLPRALGAFGTIDFAHYDSDKSAEGRAFAYPLLWQALRPGGVLFSDDINDNFGFRDFCSAIGEEPVVVRQGERYQGILRKPEEPAP